MPDSPVIRLSTTAGAAQRAAREMSYAPDPFDPEYGLRHPFVGAGMGFIAHEQLAAAVTNAVDWVCWEHPPIPQTAWW